MKFEQLVELEELAEGRIITDMPYSFLSMFIDSQGNYCQFLPQGDIYFHLVWTVKGYKIKRVIDKR